ncbi:MAG: AMP-binding protein [Solirubrobacteraceae bacterium]
MLWEDWEGHERRLTFGDMQALTSRTANALSAYGVGEGDRIAVMLPPLPESAATFLAAYKLGAILLSLSVLYGDDAIVHRLGDCSTKVIVTNAENRDRIDRVRGELPDLERVLVVDEEFGQAAARASDRFHARHAGRPGLPDLLHVGPDGSREGDRARAPLPARAK